MNKWSKQTRSDGNRQARIGANVWLDEPDQDIPRNQRPSNDSAKVERIARKSKQYRLVDEILFRWCTNGMMMKCISREDGIQ
jgi:hypothetical protein